MIGIGAPAKAPASVRTWCSASQAGTNTPRRVAVRDRSARKSNPLPKNTVAKKAVLPIAQCGPRHANETHSGDTGASPWVQQTADPVCSDHKPCPFSSGFSGTASRTRTRPVIDRIEKMVPAWLNSVALAKMRRSAKRRSHSPAHRVASARLRGTSFEDSLNGHPDAIDRAIRSTDPDRALLLPGASKVHPGNLPATSPGNFTTSFALWIYTSSPRGARRCKLASCTRKSGRINYGRLEGNDF